jgi:ubiquinone/menaquinone biosynthesis C-methylase UbiE
MNDNAFNCPESAEFYASGMFGDRKETGLSPYFSKLAEFIDKALIGSRSILDVGCATGNLFTYIRDKHPGAFYVGTDAAEIVLRAAGSLHTAAPFVCADIHQLPFRENAFDVVLCSGTLMYMADPFRCMESLYGLCSHSLLISAFTTSRQASAIKTITRTKFGNMPFTAHDSIELFAFLQSLYKHSALKDNMDVYPVVCEKPEMLGLSGVNEALYYLIILMKKES